MNITNNSYNLINFFSKLNCNRPTNITNITNNIFNQFFKHIIDGNNEIEKYKLKEKNQFYNRQ